MHMPAQCLTMPLDDVTSGRQARRSAPPQQWFKSLAIGRCPTRADFADVNGATAKALPIRGFIEACDSILLG